MNDLQVRFKVEEGAVEPRYANPGDAGMDLCITESVTLYPGDRKTVPSGVSFEIPDGWVGLVFPRSGLASKRGVTLSNAVGVIDSGYRGVVGVTLYNIGDEKITLEKGTRAAQIAFMPVARALLQQVDELSDSERGEGGFGSTGM